MEGVAPWVAQVSCMFVPPEATRLLVRGTNLPARVKPGEEAAVAIDWQGALQGQ